LTDLYGVFGNPIAHSMSPQMHNAAFEDSQLDAYYHAFNVLTDQLENALKGVIALDIKGFNVTIPHKVAIMEYLDEIDSHALTIGAVNTVKHLNGKLIGYNTDGLGFIQGLFELMNAIEDKHILVIGAGGAARGLVLSLLKENPKRLTVSNRSLDKAEKIIRECSSPGITLDTRSLHAAEEELAIYDIIINTTPIGMYPKIDEIPLNLRHLKSGTIVSDIIYNPLKTKWLMQAKEKGAIIQNGVPMFVNQGALAFEIWTGIKPNYTLMKNKVIRQLGGNANVKR
jgi:shikimate dehydrogenase